MDWEREGGKVDVRLRMIMIVVVWWEWNGMNEWMNENGRMMMSENENEWLRVNVWLIEWMIVLRIGNWIIENEWEL